MTHNFLIHSENSARLTSLITYLCKFNLGYRIIYNPNEITQDEINNVLKPFKDGFTSLPGFLGEEVTYSDNEKRISKFRFDTKEHCEDGLRYKMDSVSDLAIARNALFKRKKEEYGINYVFLTDIEL